MKPLPIVFKARGFDWRVIQREGDIAIVEQNREGWTSPVLNVVIVQKHKGKLMPSGKHNEDREALPSWESWGELAWAASSREDAERRFNALVDARANADSSIDQTRFSPSEQEEWDEEQAREAMRREIANTEIP